MEFKKEISNCHCNGDIEIVSKNISIIIDDKEYKINNATIEKCNSCGDMFIQERTVKLIEDIVEHYPTGINCAKLDKQIFRAFI